MSINSTELPAIGRFVRANRERTEAASLPQLRIGRRHVAHITQSELAEMVNVSTVVISQIEQGRYPNLNVGLLRKISRALSFSEQQEMYALGLLRPKSAEQKGRVNAPEWVIASIADTQHPVFLLDPAYAIIGWNPLAAALLGEYAERLLRIGNAAVAIFGMPEMKIFFDDWEEYASSAVSGLRMAYGVHPEYREYVGNLAESIAATDEAFHTWWFQGDPLVKPTIEKDINHPTHGRLRVFQVITGIFEAPYLSKVEFLPSDDATRAKMRSFSP